MFYSIKVIFNDKNKYLFTHKGPKWPRWQNTQIQTERPEETPPCNLVAPGASKIHFRCNVIQIIPLGRTKAGESSPPWRVKIVMICLWIIFRNESQSVGNNLQHNSSPTFNTTNQPLIRFQKQFLSAFQLIIHFVLELFTNAFHFYFE